jgi:serine/threonine-protein kinase
MLAGDAALIRRVEGLFAAQRDAHLMRTHLPGAHGPVPVPRAEALPQRIGAYRLAGLIGEGGMGTVHRAERIEGGFAHSAAIKLIRGGLFSRPAAERFARERAILARLSHPHISRLYDGGVTEEGQSYIVMELVDGPPITVHAATLGLDLRGRLALFGQVCDAASYAHQQGVVHADIKPGNILIDPTHGVKLLDFGISSLVAGEDMAATACTAAYASPQQLRGERPTPADDVFALGCLLSALTEDCAGARSRELRAVIAKARALHPRDRYASCGALADDVLRLCNNFPVRARPATRRREMMFFWRRHRLAVPAALAAAAGLSTALVVTTALEIRAEAARVQADQRFVEVRALSRYLLDDVTDQLQAFPGTSALRRDIATRSRLYLAGLSRVQGVSPDAGPAGEPDIRLEVARGYLKTGRILGLPDVQGMGDAAAAKQDLAKGEAILRALLAALPGKAAGSVTATGTSTALAQTLSARAVIARTVDNDTALSMRLDNEAIRLTTQRGRTGPAGLDPRAPLQVEQRLARARALIGLAEVFNGRGRSADMIAPLDAAEADLKDVPAEPDRVSRALTKASVPNLRGDAVYYLGDVRGSLVQYQQAASILDAARDKPPDVRLLERAAYTSWNVASVLDELGRKAEGLAVIDRGVADAALMRQFENSTRARHVQDVVNTQRAQALASLGRFDEAIAQARAEMADVRATAAASPGSFEAARAVPIVLRPVGEVYLAAGRLAEACGAFTEAMAAWHRLVGSSGVTGYDAATELPVLSREIAKCRDEGPVRPAQDRP